VSDIKQMIIEISDDRAIEIIEKAARFIVKKKMAAAAIMGIESFRPLHNLGSQAMYFLAPFAEVFFRPKEYQEFAALLEKEENVKLLLKRIDELDEELHREERKQKKILRERRRNKLKSFFNKNK